MSSVFFTSIRLSLDIDGKAISSQMILLTGDDMAE